MFEELIDAGVPERSGAVEANGQLSLAVSFLAFPVANPSL